MALRKVLFVVCLAALIICLAAGFVITGQWAGVVLALITGLIWYLARKNTITWLPHVCLLATECQAVIGLLTGFPPYLGIFSSGIALAVWDLLFLNAALGNSSSGEQTRRYEFSHLQSLALAVGFGIAAGGLGRLLHLQIPFILLVLFVVLTIFGLDRVWEYLKKTR